MIAEGRRKGRSRRVSLVVVRSGEGPFAI